MTSMAKGFSWSDENVLESVVMAAQLCDYIQSYWTVQINKVNFMVYELYVHKK